MIMLSMASWIIVLQSDTLLIQKSFLSIFQKEGYQHNQYSFHFQPKIYIIRADVPRHLVS